MKIPESMTLMNPFVAWVLRSPLHAVTSQTRQAERGAQGKPRMGCISGQQLRARRTDEELENPTMSNSAARDPDSLLGQSELAPVRAYDRCVAPLGEGDDPPA